jgi:hypothetical protein
MDHAPDEATLLSLLRVREAARHRRSRLAMREADRSHCRSRCAPSTSSGWPAICERPPKARFAPDSPLEEDGFEPPVPPAWCLGARKCRQQITDQSSIRPSSTEATPDQQSSAARPLAAPSRGGGPGGRISLRWRRWQRFARWLRPDLGADRLQCSDAVGQEVAVAIDEAVEFPDLPRSLSDKLFLHNTGYSFTTRKVRHTN